MGLDNVVGKEVGLDKVVGKEDGLGTGLGSGELKANRMRYSAG